MTIRKLLTVLVLTTVVLLGLRFSGMSGAASPAQQYCPMGSCVFGDDFDAD